MINQKYFQNIYKKLIIILPTLHVYNNTSVNDYECAPIMRNPGHHYDV